MAVSERKNTAAQQMGRLRWAKKSKAEKTAHARMMLDARWHKKPQADASAVQEVAKEDAK